MPDHYCGSCYCGAIQYTVSMAIKRVSNCHCNMCRRMNGSAFSSYAIVRDSKFAVQGETVSYPVTENVDKHFCAKCGTPLYNSNKLYPGACMVFLGSLQDHRNLAPSFNIYCESRLAWVTHLNDYPGFQQGLKD